MRFYCVLAWIVVPMVCSAQTRGHDADALVGKEVVLKSTSTDLIEDGKAVVSGRKFQRYKVERADGPLLRIVSDTLSGWVRADEVVRLDHADDFFTGRIQRNPTSSSAFWKRGMVRMYNGEVDKAIGDFGEAIHRRANSASAYNSRGLAFSKNCEYDNAISDFTQGLRIEPGNTALYFNRGAARLLKLDYEKAIADFNEAIRLDPNHLDPKAALFFNNRGSARAGQKDYPGAIADYDEALRINPRYASAYNNRGTARYNQKDYPGAIADYSEAIRLDSNSIEALGNLAWTFATCPEEKYREAKRAVGLAALACELSEWKDPNQLDTLAAAYAESGEFALSVDWQRKVLEILPRADPGFDESKSRLDLYKSRKPYRDNPGEPPRAR